MRISLNWLKDYVEIDRSAEEIAEILSNVGFPNERIEHVDGDAVIDLEITSNRSDCLSYIGVARELAAATGKKLRLPQVELVESEKNAADFVKVEILDVNLCGRYAARVIEGVKIGLSPDWMRKRLEAAGVRSVNNVVDATNYAMLETGQPPHAFDCGKIKGGRIIVRKALAGEQITSIDGSKCELETNMLIIADAEKPVAVAGVMGGLNTEVGDSTTTVLLEDAYFEPVNVRRTSRKLNLPSEAAYRFERNVDIEMIDWASKRTAQLITQVAGGAVAKGVADVYPGRPAAKSVALRMSRLEKLLGIKISQNEVVSILSALCFNPVVKQEGVIECAVPSWRNDIYREVDLIEEVARLNGYNKISAKQKISIEVAPVDQKRKFTAKVLSYLCACGFYETVNVTFVDRVEAEIFTEFSSLLSAGEVAGKKGSVLRATLLSSLLDCLRTNYNAKNIPCRLFELAATFRSSDKQLPNEKIKLALVCDGEFRQLKGVIEGLVQMINADARLEFSPAEFLWSQAGAEIRLNGEVLGSAGCVSEQALAGMGIKGVKPCAAELEFELLEKLQAGQFKLKPIPKFPSVTRDISVIVAEEVRWADIFDVIKTRSPQELEDVKFVGLYRGNPIPAGKKSITVSLCFRDDDGTLTHEQVDEFEKEILAGLSGKISAEIRSQ